MLEQEPMTTTAGFTDISAQHWVTALPQPWRNYGYLLRLDRPIGTWLLLLPGWWALALTGLNLWYLLLFAIGSVIMRGAGCIINDLWDRDFDRQVERTRARPLASGAVSPREALQLLALLLVLGFLILSAFNSFALLMGSLSLVLIITYPLMKRITWWPQAFLGFTFNWGVILGAAVATGTLPLWVWPMYAAGVLWTLGYDTIYAHADTTDDALIGVKSTARLFGRNSKKWVAGFYVGAGLLLVLAGLTANVGGYFYAILALTAIPTTHLIWTWRVNEPEDCILCFRANRMFGLLVFAACVSGTMSV
jgi:4-hydroxybenzoate polyprenyltransferase